jgi:hypothetical protein
MQQPGIAISSLVPPRVSTRLIARGHGRLARAGKLAQGGGHTDKHVSTAARVGRPVEMTMLASPVQQGGSQISMRCLTRDGRISPLAGG